MPQTSLEQYLVWTTKHAEYDPQLIRRLFVLWEFDVLPKPYLKILSPHGKYLPMPDILQMYS